MIGDDWILYVSENDKKINREKYPLHCKFEERMIELKEMQKKRNNINESVYVVVIENEIELRTHFRAIKDIIYGKSRIKLLDIYIKLINNNIDVIGANVDCVLYENKNNVDLNKIFNFENKLGCYKIEKDKKPINTELNIVVQNELIKINEVNPVIHDIVDEYNQEEFNCIYEKNNRVITIGGGGFGKSYSVKKYDDEILFITPFNKLSIQINKELNEKKNIEEKKIYAITNNKLLGMHVIDDTKLKSYDVSNIKTICFDEVYLYNPAVLMKIDKYIKAHPEIKFLATGDIFQLKPFGYPMGNIQNVSDYQKYCVNKIFNNKIELKINKRLTNEDDKIKMYNLTNVIFDENKNTNMIKLLQSYGIKIIDKMSQLTTTNNITYFNYKSEQVNKYVQNNLIKIPKKNVEYKGIKFYKNLEIVCKKYAVIGLNNKTNNDKINSKNVIHNYLKDKIIKQEIIKDKKITYLNNKDDTTIENKMKLHINNEYIIYHIDNDNIIIKDIDENKAVIFEIKKLNHFKLNYSNTLHSVQGLTIKNELTIFNIDAPHIDANYVYTAITRTDNLENIYIYQANSYEVEMLNESMKKRFYEMKIQNYKNQDKISHREIIKEEYINCEWFEENLKTIKHCQSCRNKFYLYIKDGEIMSNITCKRINNNESHHKNNCELMCKDCNCAMSDKDIIIIQTDKNINNEIIVQEIVQEKIKRINNKKVKKVKQYHNCMCKNNEHMEINEICNKCVKENIRLF